MENALWSSLTDGPAADAPELGVRASALDAASIGPAYCTNIRSNTQHIRPETPGLRGRFGVAELRRSCDGWRTVQYTPTKDSGLGIHFADLDAASLKPGGAIVFTLYWPVEDRWEGVDYDVAVE